MKFKFMKFGIVKFIVSRKKSYGKSNHQKTGGVQRNIKFYSNCMQLWCMYSSAIFTFTNNKHVLCMKVTVLYLTTPPCYRSCEPMFTCGWCGRRWCHELTLLYSTALR